MFTIEIPCQVNDVHRVIAINRFPSTHGFQIIILEFHCFPIIVIKYSSCGLKPIIIVLSTCGILSLQKQRMIIIYYELLRRTAVSTVISGKSDLLGQCTIHNISNCLALLYHLTKTALVLFIIQKHPLL